MATNRYRISGVVQGVGFRYYTQSRANSLGLTGWVRNLVNGDVEVLACGEQAQLDELFSWLEQGPPLARVDNVEAEVIEVAELHSGFSIR